MSEDSVDALLRLPRQQRLELAEKLWLSVADETEPEVPPAHAAVVAERLSNYHAGHSTPIPCDELMRRLGSE